MYKVAISGKIGQELIGLHGVAQAHGKHLEFVDALKSIYDQLQTDPYSLGEPTFHYRQLKLINCKAIVRPLVIEFCIDDLGLIVYLRTVALFGFD